VSAQYVLKTQQLAFSSLEMKFVSCWVSQEVGAESAEGEEGEEVGVIAWHVWYD
jgi:hypothetical protein